MTGSGQRPDRGRHVGLTRREMLKRGAVGGALVWSVPAIQALGLGATAAQATSGSGPTYCIPSNGVVFFTLTGSPTVYGVKIDSSGTIGSIPTKSPQFQFNSVIGNTAPLGQQYPATWSNYPGTLAGGLTGTVNSFLILPANATLVGAWVLDGNINGGTTKTKTGHMIAPAHVDSSTSPIKVTFFKLCSAAAA